MVSGETSPNAATVRPFSLFTSHMKQERTKCQPHPIHRLSVQGKDTFYQKQIRRARGTALKKTLSVPRKSFSCMTWVSGKVWWGEYLEDFCVAPKDPIVNLKYSYFLLDRQWIEMTDDCRRKGVRITVRYSGLPVLLHFLISGVGAHLDSVVSGSDKAETSIKHFPIRSAIGESWRRLKAGVIKRRWRRGSLAFPFSTRLSSSNISFCSYSINI